jgi:OHCU decarboxylase
VQSISTLNDLPADQFAEALRPLFEAAPPLAEALYAARPFAFYPALIDAAELLALSMASVEQVAVLSAHPRIGADPATVSTASYREQGYATEGGMDAARLARIYSDLADLNAEYERRFGFRFVVFVNGRSKAEIIEVLRGRLRNSREFELETGLREMFQIARARLRASARIGTTPVREDDPARQAVLEELRRAAVETYGEDRAAESTLRSALQASATAIWRVTQESLDPAGSEP